MAEGVLPSLHARQVLKLLKEHHNVLISGPPGTGKSLLLNEVARWFPATAHPGHDPEGDIPLPEGLVITPEHADEWLPSPEREDRHVFQTALHSGSKYREFMRGLVPAVGTAGTFTLSKGILYRAALVGLSDDGAAMLVVDEINRGPAIQVFGDVIVALEGDKRLDVDGVPKKTTQWIEVPDDNGTPERFAFPYHLYVLAAMNQADTSVEPLDVAFQRRFEHFKLAPDDEVLREFFSLEESSGELPDLPGDAADVYRAAIRAWAKVNARIALGRGQEFTLGHGVFMDRSHAPPEEGAEQALAYIRPAWRTLRNHIDEVFFGHARGAGAALNVGATGHPFTLVETFFAGDPVVVLREDGDNNLYKLLLAVARDDAE
jgi:5-methylcytosine-specific restriction protein B